MMLGAYCWAVADEQYEFWILNKLWFFYTLSFVNLLIFIVGMGVGSYYYLNGSGLYSFLGIQCVSFFWFGSSSLMVAIGTAFYYIEVRFNGKPATEEDQPEKQLTY